MLTGQGFIWLGTAICAFKLFRWEFCFGLALFGSAAPGGTGCVAKEMRVFGGWYHEDLGSRRPSGSEGGLRRYIHVVILGPPSWGP